MKRCICTWGGKGKSVTPRIPVVSYQGNADDTEKGSHLWKYFENFSKIFPQWHHLSYPFGILYTESWIAQTPFLNSQLSTHFDFPRRFSSRFFRETIWQKAFPIKKARWKIPLSFIGLFAYSMPKGSFPLPGSLKIPDPHKKSKKSGACFSQLSRNASYNFSMISTSLSFTIHSLYDRTGILLWYARADKIHFVLLVS